MDPRYEMVIGLEVHAQVNVKSKLFSASPTDFGAEPNTQANEIDMGMPGVLPVLNRDVVDAAIKLGLGIKARINRTSVFSRKNYFYPDLPKGYQISQFDLPIVEHGTLTIDLDDGSSRDIGVTRIHIEEDAGKSVHDFGDEKHSHVDLNRAGVPLVEIVSEPDMRTAEEAGAYMKKMRAIVRFIDVCDGNMEQGSMRCDANVSVRLKGVETLGTRCEIKNLNSIRNVMRAIDFEANRQIAIIEHGGEVEQQTRLWDAAKSETRAMRSKEDAHDYRYFPDPDLLPLKLTEERIEAAKAAMPELPDEMKERFIKEYTLSAYDASVLTLSRAGAHYFEALVDGKRDAKKCVNWMTVELFGALNKEGLDIHDSPISPDHLGELVDLIEDATISGKIAKTVFEEMWTSGKAPKTIVEEKGLVQITDSSMLEGIVDKLIEGNPENSELFRSGNDRILGWFVGQVMKETQGKANPQMVNEILRGRLRP
ncbi:MAG: Asp-tRNA(Asn)/Glu-tRNA(Gln) amidotransferase subunit GatB [Alphaproteobacteria bacterium]|nr:Asp-tRNA(Asn)/Glu-tRNA(Gln) amidotransferase subunit GatB [Alphaproteobacteria bacterium]